MDGKAIVLIGGALILSGPVILFLALGRFGLYLIPIGMVIAVIGCFFLPTRRTRD